MWNMWSTRNSFKNQGLMLTFVLWYGVIFNFTFKSMFLMEPNVAFDQHCHTLMVLSAIVSHCIIHQRSFILIVMQHKKHRMSNNIENIELRFFKKNWRPSKLNFLRKWPPWCVHILAVTLYHYLYLFLLNYHVGLPQHLDYFDTLPSCISTHLGQLVK